MEEVDSFFNIAFDLLLAFQTIKNDIRTFISYVTHLKNIDKQSLLTAHATKPIVNKRKICKLIKIGKNLRNRNILAVKKSFATSLDPFVTKNCIGNLQVLDRFLKKSHLETIISLEPLFTFLIGENQTLEFLHLLREIHNITTELKALTSSVIAKRGVKREFLTNEKVQLLLSLVKK